MKSKVPLIVIVAATLIPRLLHLNTFLTLDESLWLNRSRHFLLALLSHDWATTFQTGHPGVTTMWGGFLGLWGYGLVQGLMRNGTFIPFLQRLTWNHQPVDLITYTRLPTVLIASLGIVGVYYLLRRLFDRRVALVGGLLLALDPWYLAHSRILHHDALMTTFMTLSALALLVHVNGGPTRWPLLLSGVCAGLAFLSKTLSSFLLPWTVFLFVIALWQRRWPLFQVVIDSVVWSLTAWLTFYLFWPAMWLSPRGTLWRMVQMVVTYAINPHEKGQFFLGQPVADPGPFFYPLVALFALTPLMMVGLAAIVWARLARVDLSFRSKTVTLLLVYIVAYVAFISFGEKKQIRYLLPAIVMLNVVAATGLVWLGDFLVIKTSRRLPQLANISGIKEAALISVILAVQAVTVLPHHPYYFTYYNPLIGGNRLAARWILVGWGEGNNLAAQYLNNLPEAEQLTVVTSNPSTFAPFFPGKTLTWRPEAQMLVADYLVLYRRDAQRDRPDAHILRYIEQNWPLEATIQLHGLDYAWIYRAPAADWASRVIDVRSKYEQAGLIGYRLNHKSVSPGETLVLTLYRQHWPAVTGRWLIQLQGSDGWWTAQPSPANSDNKTPQPGEIVEDVYHWAINQQMQPGSYQVRIGLQREANANVQWITPHVGPPPYVHLTQE